MRVLSGGAVSLSPVISQQGSFEKPDPVLSECYPKPAMADVRDLKARLGQSRQFPLPALLGSPDRQLLRRASRQKQNLAPLRKHDIPLGDGEPVERRRGQAR